MSASSVERIKTSLVALKMPRALEILDATLRGIERGEVGAVEALLTEELTMRVKMAVQMAKLSAIFNKIALFAQYFFNASPIFARFSSPHGASSSFVGLL
ncbi:hypothetical protein Q2941_49160 [Bradyrhizobium sp. UFLA05-153]